MRYIIILALVLCLAVSALAIPLGTEKSYIVDELNQLTTQTNTLRLLTRLNLSINQKAAIAPIVREQIQDKNAIIRLENSCSADYEIAIEKLRSAVIANNGVSEEIKQGVRNAQKLYKSMEEKLEKATPIRAEQIWNILNAEQKQIAVSQGIIAKKRNLNSNIVSPEFNEKVEKFILNNLMNQTALCNFDPSWKIDNPQVYQSPKLKSMLADIRVMNLVNSMYLTPEQTKKLIPLIKDAQSDYLSARVKESLIQREAIDNQRKILDTTVFGTKKNVSAENQVVIKNKRALQTLSKSLDDKYLPKLQSILTPNQIVMAANFVPCVVPVQSLTNPERIGQADGNSKFEKSLERIRTAAPARIQTMTSRLQTQTAELWAKKKHPKYEIDAVIAQIPSVIEQARNMDDAQFALKKCELAQIIAVPAKVAQGAGLDKRLTEYLLSPNLAPILESRL